LGLPLLARRDLHLQLEDLFVSCVLAGVLPLVPLIRQPLAGVGFYFRHAVLEVALALPAVFHEGFALLDHTAAGSAQRERAAGNEKDRDTAEHHGRDHLPFYLYGASSVCLSVCLSGGRSDRGNLQRTDPISRLRDASAGVRSSSMRSEPPDRCRRGWSTVARSLLGVLLEIPTDREEDYAPPSAAVAR
jgi:hypothetical protein